VSCTIPPRPRPSWGGCPQREDEPVGRRVLRNIGAPLRVDPAPDAARTCPSVSSRSGFQERALHLLRSHSRQLRPGASSRLPGQSRGACLGTSRCSRDWGHHQPQAGAGRRSEPGHEDAQAIRACRRLRATVRRSIRSGLARQCTTETRRHGAIRRRSSLFLRLHALSNSLDREHSVNPLGGVRPPGLQVHSLSWPAIHR